jgi:hypothetical protein
MLAQRQDHGDLSAGKFSIYFFPTTTGENKRASDAGCKPFSMHVGQSAVLHKEPDTPSAWFFLLAAKTDHTQTGDDGRLACESLKKAVVARSTTVPANAGRTDSSTPKAIERS